MTIKLKVLSSGVVIIILVALVAFFAAIGVSRLDDSFSSLQQHEITTKLETIKIGREINYFSRLTRNIMLGSDFDKEFKKLDETIEKISKSFDLLQKAAETQEDKKLVEQAKSDALAFVNDGRSRMLALKDVEKESRPGAFKEYEQFATPLAMKSRESFDLIIKNADKRFDVANEQFESTIHRTFKTIAIASAVAIVFIIVAIFTLLRIILGPIALLKTTLQNIRSSWDLTKRLDAKSNDELGQIASETNAFIDALQNIITAVNSSSTRVSGASINLTEVSGQIATSIEEVGSQAATVATASEEMSSTIVDIAGNCNRAAELSNQAKYAASNGSSVVRETVTGMARIAEKVKLSAKTVESLGARSDQIGAIIGTIEDIADQTNLLALNAAIEAARAGEQGRGFAVVADEVRALAERTTRATREIGEMIKTIQSETKGAVAIMEDGVHEVESGTSGAAKSGMALDEIQEKISELSIQVHLIASATEEQSATIGEITHNIHQITEVIHTASNGTQQTSHSANELNNMANELQRLVQQFKL